MRLKAENISKKYSREQMLYLKTFSSSSDAKFGPKNSENKAKWKEVYDNPELAKNIYTLLLQSLGKENVKLDEDEYTDIFVPCVSAQLCNWSYKLITEKELDYFIKEKNSPTQQHWKQYRSAMINSKDDNIGTAIIGKAMEYFGIK